MTSPASMSAWVLLFLAPALVAGCQVPGASAGPGRKSPVADAAAGHAALDASAAKPAPQAQAGKREHDERRACRKDADCAFWEQPCACPPCGSVWRTVYNRKKVAEMQASWARKRCVREPCPACTGQWLGSKAVCIHGQCAAR